MLACQKQEMLFSEGLGWFLFSVSSSFWKALSEQELVCSQCALCVFLGLGRSTPLRKSNVIFDKFNGASLCQLRREEYKLTCGAPGKLTGDGAEHRCAFVASEKRPTLNKAGRTTGFVTVKVHSGWNTDWKYHHGCPKCFDNCTIVHCASWCLHSVYFDHL